MKKCLCFAGNLLKKFQIWHFFGALRANLPSPFLFIAKSAENRMSFEWGVFLINDASNKLDGASRVNLFCLFNVLFSPFRHNIFIHPVPMKVCAHLTYIYLFGAS